MPSSSAWWPALLVAVLASLLSLSGALALLLREAQIRRLVPLLLSLAVGVMLGDAFLHLIPEAAARLGSLSRTGLLVLAGMLLFFLLERYLRGSHDHAASATGSARIGARMLLFGDAVHNLTDGILIGGTFAVDLQLGVATSAAILAHEIPQEVGDIGALIHGGYAPRRALWLNFLSSLPVIGGAMLTLLLADRMEGFLPLLLPIAAGGFIYIATADLIPTLHGHHGMQAGALHGALMTAGAGAMLLLGVLEHAALHELAPHWHHHAAH